MDVSSTGSMQRTDTQSRDHGQTVVQERGIHCVQKTTRQQSLCSLVCTLDGSIYVITEKTMHISICHFQLFQIEESQCKDFFFALKRFFR